jgi:Uma2 family endonuclease
MAAVIQNAPVPAPHFKLTVEDYYRMGEAGILGADDRVELIEGEIIEMPPIACFHAGLGSRISDWLMRLLVGRAIAWARYPIRLSGHSAPQPDLALLKFRSDYYKGGLPTPADVLLVVEIADTSLHTDREVKAPLYAKHGIPEYWLVDLKARCVEVYLTPEEGRYQSVQTHKKGILAPQAFPEAGLDIGGLFSG